VLTRSISSTSRTYAAWGASSANAERSYPGASPAVVRATSASWRTRSSRRARWPCCRTSRRT